MTARACIFQPTYLAIYSSDQPSITNNIPREGNVEVKWTQASGILHTKARLLRFLQKRNPNRKNDCLEVVKLVTRVTVMYEGLVASAILREVWKGPEWGVVTAEVLDSQID